MRDKPKKPFKGPEKPWEAMAAGLGAEFVVPKWSIYGPHLKYPFRQGHVKVYRETSDSDAESTVFTMPVALKRNIRVGAFKNNPGQKLISLASRLFKADPVQIPGLHESITITNSGEDHNQLIFGDKTAQLYLNNCPSYILGIDRKKSKEYGEIKLIMPGIQTDAEILKAGILFICHLAGILEDNGLISTDAGDEAEDKQGRLAWIPWVIVGLVVVLGIWGVCFLISSMSSIQRSEHYQTALLRARKSELVIRATGEPIKNAWLVNSASSTRVMAGQSAGLREFKVSFDVSGPRGSGSIKVHAEKENGKWVYHYMFFESDDELIYVNLNR